MRRTPIRQTILVLLAAAHVACTSATETRSTPAPAASSSPPNVRLGPAGQSYVDPEFLAEEALMVFQDSADQSIWLGRLDPETGGLASRTGKDHRVDVGIAPIYRSLNGPEFGVDRNGWAIYYTKPSGRGDKTLQIWQARPSGDASRLEFALRRLTGGVGHQTAIARKDPRSPSTQVFAIAGAWRDGDAVWFDVNSPERTETFIRRRPSGTNAEFIPASDAFVTSIPDADGIRQLAIVDQRNGRTKTITSGGADLSSAWAWRAPEYDDAPAVLALENQAAIGVWVRRGAGDWQKLTRLPIPDASGMQRLRSPEAFAFQGSSYIVFSAHGAGRHSASEVWVYSLDGSAERCDNGQPGVFRSEPEPVVIGGRAYVYYSIRRDRTNWELWRCEPGLGG